MNGKSKPEVDEEELEERTKEIWQQAKEKNRNDKDDAGLYLAEKLAKKELVERWERENR